MMKMPINRREFLSTSSRFAGSIAALSVASRFVQGADEKTKPTPLSDAFPLYKNHDPLVPVYCVTPNMKGCFHRFFSTSPISPSGRYLAATRMIHEERMLLPGETAEIVLVDLLNGTTRVIAETKGSDSQLGAQAQWGATDEELYFNDVDTEYWHGHGVRVNPFTGERRDLEGPLFEVSQDGRYVVGICLSRCAITQLGYGVVVPTDVLPWNEGAASDDGVYLTDTATGKCQLVASYKDIVEAAGEKVRPRKPELGGGYHGHQISWNPQGTRLMLCLAHNYPKPRIQKKYTHDMNLITLKPDGSDVHVPIPALVWSGNHPCWCPDGEHISMNYRLEPEKRYDYHFIRMRYDGQNKEPMSTLVGTGHPTLHPNGRNILTDTYQNELHGFEYKDGLIPFRWIDIAKNTEKHLVRICSRPPTGPFGDLRVDPHPAWDRTYTRVAFNACPKGTRQVFIADLSEYVS